MTEPTFPQTLSSPWREWEHTAPDGAVVRIRRAAPSGRSVGGAAYIVSVDGRRVDSFLTLKAAQRKARAIIRGAADVASGGAAP